MRARLINEEMKDGSLFRSTDQKWLRILLDYMDDAVEPFRKDGFISLSRDSESGGMDDFGGKEVTIEFDENMIFDQDAIEIYYDPDFFETYPKICRYVTGYESEEDYYKQKGYENSEAAWANNDLSWEDIISDYEHEEEILLKKLSYKDGLIKHVIIYKNIHPILKDMLNDRNISYTIK